MALTKASRSMLNTGISDSSDATALTFDSSENATFAGHISLADSKQIKLGAGSDLQLYHDSSNSFIKNTTNDLYLDTASGAIHLTKNGTSEVMASFNTDSSVTLRHNNSIKFATAADGIDVTGHIDAATITTTGAGTIGGNLTVTGNLQVDGTTTTINSTTYTVDDLNITLASGAGSSSAADGAGITIDGAAATWNYTHSNTSWVANKNVRAPRFLSTSNSSSNFYSVLATRSGSGTSNPDIYGSSNTLVLGYSDSGKAVHFNSTGADFAGTITSAGTIASGGNITAISASSPTLEIKDTTNNVQFKAYAQNSNAHLGTISNHSLIIDTNNTAAISIDSSQNTTVANHLIVDGNTTLGNADTDTVTVPGPLAVDTDTLYVDVTNDRVSINSGTSPSTALDVTGIVSADNLALGGATVANSYLIEATAGSGNIIRSTRGSSVFAAYQSNNSHVYLGTTSDNEFRLIQNDGTALTIDTDRNVGISTPSPEGLLHVHGGDSGSSYTADGADKLIVEHSDSVAIDLRTPASNQALIMFSDGTRSQGLIGYNHSDDSMRFSNSGNLERMRIKSDGNVGIGTNNPSHKLDVTGTIRAYASGSGNAWLYTQNDNKVYLTGVRGSSSNAYSIYDLTADKSRFRVNSDGGIAIGENNVGYAGQILSVKAGTGNTVLYGESSDATCQVSLRDNSSTANIGYAAVGNSHVFMKDSTEYLRIDSSGNMLLQNGSPEFHFGTTSATHRNWRIACQEVVDQGFEIASGTTSAGSNAGSDTYTNRLTIDGATGQVNLPGTTQHTYLHVKANSGVGAATKYTSGSNAFTAGMDTAAGIPDNMYGIAATTNSNTKAMVIDQTGRVGVGHSNPTGLGRFAVYGSVGGGDAHGDPDITKSYGTNITAVNGSTIEITTSIASSNTTPTLVITWNKGSWASFSYDFRYSGASYSGGRFGGGYHNNSGNAISGHTESGYGNDYLTITGSGQTLYFSFGFPSGYHPTVFAKFMGGGGMGYIAANEFTVSWTT